MKEYDWADDAKKCYYLALKASREKRVRRNEFAANTPQELQQQIIGPVKPSQYDCVKKP